MLGKIKCRQWKLAELTRYHPLGADFFCMTIKNLTVYGFFAHQAWYLINEEGHKRK